jgi:hypothetical protein
MVPSTYEAGKLYNVLPSGNRAPDSTDQNSGYDQTRADFDFDRGSNAAATRVNSDGLIEKYRENELLQSNQFDTTWSTTSSITLTSGQSGYDGSNDAWLLARTSTGGQRVAQTISSSGVQTYSVYAKANVGDWLYMRCNTSGSPAEAYFDLANGTLGAYGLTTRIDAKIEAVGNGWYRCSMAFNNSVVEVRLYPTEGNNSVGGTNESIFIQSAQLESGLVATDYLESTSVTGKAGVLVDLPRINYDANGENGALLLEPSRQQLLQYSEYFGGWSIYASAISSVVDNYATSPEGIINASKINFIVQGDSDLALYQSHSVTGGSTYTYSIYIKGEGSDVGKDIVIKSKRSGGDPAGTTTIQTLTSEWKRIDFSTTYAANNTSANLFISSNDATSCLVYGAMAELGSYPSSYIPNNGTSGGVTRAADAMSKDDLSTLIHSPEGTLFLEVAALADDGTNRYFSINDGTTSNYIYFRYVSTSNNMIMRVNIGGVTINTLTYVSPDTTIFSKVALKWKGGDYAFWVNGIERGTDTSATSFGAGVLNEILCDFPTGSGAGFPSKTKQVALFNEALSDSELATLTTL